MALITTVGGSTSNSYATVAEADTYFSLRYVTASWDALTTAQKEKALATATRQIDELNFRESRAGTEVEGDISYQRLQFPRSYMVDVNGAAIVAKEVKDAQCEQAYFIVVSGAEAEKRLQLQAQGVSSYALGAVEDFNAPSISENFENRSGFESLIAPAALRLLRSHLLSGIEFGRG